MKSFARKQSSNNTFIKTGFKVHHNPIAQIQSLSPFSINDTIIQCKPNCPCGGGCPQCKDAPLIQTKLKVSEPGDKYEQEADRVADQIMRMPDDEVSGISQCRNGIQRKCTSCSSGGESCTEGEEQEQGLVQRKLHNDSEANDTSVPDNFINNLGPGQPLDLSTRAFFEPRFGHDFGKVRVHTSSKAAESAQSVNALAYTLGQDVVFGSGQYAPMTMDGRKLLAHEFTHVIQQGKGDTLQAIQRAVRPENVSCRETGVDEFNLSGDEAVNIIQAADAEAIELAARAEELLKFELFLVQAGEPVDMEFDTILQEELGLTLTNPRHFRLIQQQIDRFRRVRETLESGYLRYICLGLGTQRLVGCAPGDPCRGDRASGFSCPGNRLVGLCRPFWFDETVRATTILHEPFHIWFTMASHAPDALRRADASCFDAFALRVAGLIPFVSCVDHTNG